MELPKRYDPKESEPKWQKFWEDQGIFRFDKESDKEVYSIDTPPPYVSAEHLHVGHALSYSQAEFIARYKRMKGFNVFYPMGFDDNGLPTERFVEKKYNINKAKIARPEFVKLCLEETKKGIETYRNLWNKLGISVDWSLLYSTIDPRCTRIAQKSFLDLFNKKLLSRKEDPIIWCSSCGTALAQAELEDLEKSSFLNDVSFKGADGKDLVISTTRPELIGACVAVYAHPEDERYKHLKGSKITVPLFGHEVPFMTSDKVKLDFGTGLMMVCTWGDVEDIEKWKVDGLETRQIVDKNGILNEKAGEYKGMTFEECRKKILKDLQDAGKLVKQEQISHIINIHDRCGTPAEFVKVPQWHIHIVNKKFEIMEKSHEVNWYPDFMKVRLDEWVKGLKWDWTISRERYYGVPFPVWYCKGCGKVLLADEADLPVDPTVDKPRKKCACGAESSVPEMDVMDTWMTSSLTPLIVADWGKNDALMEKIYPMDLRPQAHEIIRTWAFYTIVKSLYHHNHIPWKNIMISGHGLDATGKKMSKSKGNAIWADTIGDKWSADSFRFFAASVKLGQDLVFSEKEILTGKKLVTKLWNACKFGFMHLQDYTPTEVELEEVDRWVLDEMHKVIKTCTVNFDNYEYSKTKTEVDKFFWKTICDNYLEIVKDRLYNPEKRGENSRKSAQHTLYLLLLNSLKLLAPIMPFITEEIYQAYFRKHEGHKSIHISPWPQYKEVDDSLKLVGETVLYAVDAARKAKTEKQVSLRTPVKKFLIKSKLSKVEFKKVYADIKAATNAEELSFEQIPAESKIDFEHEIELGAVEKKS